MRHTRPGGLPLALVFAVAALVPAAAEARADRIDDYIARVMREHRLPGVSLAIARGGRIIRSGGYGTASLELGVAASDRTVYEIGSISKQVAAEAVMLLVEDGKIDLDERARHYLPELPEAWSAITVRHLLTHTGGLKDWEAAGGFLYTLDHSPADFIAFVAKYPLDFQPGTRWSYTNSGPPILGLIVEKVTGQPYTAFVAERIFKPTGLDTMRFKVNGDIVANRADGYILANDVMRRGQPLRPQVIAPSGGVMASVTDVARWVMALWAGRIVKPATLDAMLTPARLTGGETVSHGFAWFFDTFNGHRFVMHWGSTIAGYSAVVYRLPADDLTIVLAANLDDGAFGVDAMAKFIANEFVPGAAFAGLQPQPDPEPAATRAIAAMLHEIADGRDPGLLAAAERSRLTAAGRSQLAERFPAGAHLVYLGEEPRTPFHFGAGSEVVRLRRYQVAHADRDVYFTLLLAKDGSVVRFTQAEERR